MYGRKDLLESLKPYKVLPAPEQPPGKWEMGTRDQSLFASIGAAIEYLEWLGDKVEGSVSQTADGHSKRRRRVEAALNWIEQYEEELSNAMLRGIDDAQGMSSLAGIELYGISDPSQIHLRVPTFTFNILGADPLKVAQYLWDKHSVAVLAENHGGFYSRTLNTYGKSIAVRASPVHFNTVQEVGLFLHALEDTIAHLGQ